jgi:ribose 5-phosphate isomerase B
MKIFVGADHKGFELKTAVIKYLNTVGYKAIDVGDKEFSPDDDFPVFATAAVNKVLCADSNEEARAVLICGSGQGMVMAANRHRGIRAGLGWSSEAARGIRNDEDSNVLALPAQIFEGNNKKAFEVIDTWLNTPFAGAARYIRRLNELDNL